MRWNEVFKSLPSSFWDDGDSNLNRLAHYFSALPGYVVSRDELLDLLYSGDKYIDDVPSHKVMEVQVCKLRKFLKDEWKILHLPTHGWILERTERAKRYFRAEEGPSYKAHSGSYNTSSRGTSTSVARRYCRESNERRRLR